MTQKSEHSAPDPQYPYPFDEFMQDSAALEAAGPSANSTKEGAIAFLTERHRMRSADSIEVAFKVNRFIAILGYVGEHMNSVAIGDVSPREPEEVSMEILRHSFQAVHEAYQETPPDPAHPLDLARMWARVRQLGNANRLKSES